MDNNSPHTHQQAKGNYIAQAADGSTAIVGDVHIHTRSQAEELREYLAQAVAAYEARMYQLIATRAALPEHPYKLLHPFKVEDADTFFGRDAATEELYEKVLSSRLTVLHARSGAGKTSLLNAGLSPRLIGEGHLPVYVRTRAYEEDLALAAKRAIAPPSHVTWPELMPTLSLHEFLSLACTHLNQTRELVVIFDGFEEFLVSLPEPGLRLPFISALSDCCEDQSLPVRFIIALRREHIWDLDEFQQLFPRILQNRYGLPLMTQSEIVEAITGPVSQLRREASFEPALLETLLDDLGRTDVELTHLQIVCTKLFDSLPKEKRIITVDLYRSLGQIERILTTYLNDTLSKLPHHKRSAARNILKALVSSEGTNRILNLAALEMQVPQDPNLLEDVLERLVDTRLLRREEDTEVTEYELAHTYLAEEIIHWIGRDELENKRSQALLQRGLVDWRVHGALVDDDRLDILRDHVQYLALDSEAQTLLLNSALGQGHDVGFWVGQVEDKEIAVGQIANRLVDNRHLRRKITSDLRSNLERPLRRPLFSALLKTFDNVKGTKRRSTARVLWALRSWLSIEELLRVVGVLAPVWAVQSIPFVLVLIFLLLGGSRIWTFLTREQAIPVSWVRVPEGSFTMGFDQTEADFARTLCLEGGVFDESDCPDPEKLLRWSGRQTDARLPAFAIMDNEATNAQYRRCLDAGVCQVSEDWSYDSDGVNKPATGVSWTEAMLFCRWLGGRLPTEGEWEKAARGPDGSYFPWGNDWDSSMANLERQIPGSAHVTRYAESDIGYYGVKNMAGNVREWTASVGYPLPSGGVFANSVLMPDQVDENIPVVVRGGSWTNERSVGMVAMRGTDAIYMRRPETGFRCVCPTGMSCESPFGAWWIWFGEY
ncbi:MAG: hypothetical protein DRJ03_09415 [Chloroflexi bacterium]|nr:MAG: hypothetical protein DRI81_01270 [Chloroflexota bacterium]RLC86213.1 MAG: hypothetical protein DRJ03_09415 [Chloroflexota bacterium]